ncbi:MAG: RIP metalloprotease RseP [Dehalococcoidales bacterium]|nr:RIP metalloprotease RseP [Dehalococcoidales bacterium]
MLTTALIFIGVLVGLILAHEFGHFITAKAFRVEVKEFGVGFPPRIFSRKRGETVYSLNAIPLGGFTKLAGEEDPDTPRSLSAKPTGIRLLVLSAGSLMNLVIPLALFTIAFMVPHDVVMGKVLIEEVAPESPAATAGLESGDTIISLNDKAINNTGDLQRYIQLNLGRETEITVEHGDSTVESFGLVPRWRPPVGQGAIGVAVKTVDASIVRRSEPAWRAAPLGATTCIETFVLFKNGILSMITGATPVEVVGPVGIAEMTGEVARAGMSPLLEFVAFLSINLGLINLLPLPALDGGRIVFVLLEKARGGKRILPRTQGLVHLIGFILLIGILIAITFNDITRIVGGGG